MISKFFARELGINGNDTVSVKITHLVWYLILLHSLSLTFAEHKLRKRMNDSLNFHLKPFHFCRVCAENGAFLKDECDDNNDDSLLIYE